MNSPERVSENMDSILRRVQKLLAIAGDGRGNPEEAAAAASMAAKIMRKYQLEHEDVIVSQLNAGEGMEEEWVSGLTSSTDGRAKTVPSWVQWMAVSLAKVHELKVTISRVPAGRPNAGDGCIRFAGYSSDVQVASWTLSYLVRTVNNLTDAYRKTPRYMAMGRGSSAAFRSGAASGISQLILEQHAKEQAANPSEGRSLMVVKARAVADKFGENKYRNTKKDVRDATAYGQGYEQGKRVDITRRGVSHSGGSSSSTLYLGR